MFSTTPSTLVNFSNIFKPFRASAIATVCGVVTITASSPAPFLGFAAGKLGGPTVISLRMRSVTGGAGKVKSVAFTLKASTEWQELTITLPAEGALGILRLYLLAQKEPLMLDWIAMKPTQGRSQRWSFDK